MSEQAATVFHEGLVQHWIKEVGNRESRLIYQGELADIEP